MGTCGACCHNQGKKYITDKEAKLRDRALGRAKELIHMGTQGADKLLQDGQTYHDMHHEIVKMKMHQITPPRNGGKYGEKPCENPQCSECPKPLGSWIQQQQPGGHRAAGAKLQQQEATRSNRHQHHVQEQRSKTNSSSYAIAAKSCHSSQQPVRQH
jgi:hypothetical protein